MSSSNNTSNNASGMGKSAPLVQIQSTPPAQSVNVHDHPLAIATTTSATPANAQQEPSSSSGNRRLATPASIMTSMTLSSMAPPPTGAATVAVPKAMISPSPPLGGLQSQSADDLADAFLRGEQLSHTHAPLLRPKPLPETRTELERVRILVERRAWGDVLSVTNSLLKGGATNNNNTNSHYAALYAALLKNTSKNAPTSLLNPLQVEEFTELLLLQGHAWMHMRRFKELGAEVHEWTPCHVYTKQQSQQGGGDKQPVPWKICVFAAASLQYTLPQHKDAATTALWKVRQDILAALKNTTNDSSPIVTTTKLDLLHVDLTLSNMLLAQGQSRVAVECLDRSLEYLSEAATILQDQYKLTEDERQSITQASQAEILTRQARILLQVGALDGAFQLLERTQNLWEHAPSIANKQELYGKFPQAARLLEQAAPQLETAWGLWHFAQKQEASYNVALEHFRKALQLMSENTNDDNDATTASSQYLSTDWLGGGLVAPLARHVLYAETSNNIAVTALYTVGSLVLGDPSLLGLTPFSFLSIIHFNILQCRLQEAVHVLEGIIRQNPSEALTERSALNLCTLYELSGDAASSTRKKKTLQMIAKRFFLHDIGPESFRL